MWKVLKWIKNAANALAIIWLIKSTMQYGLVAPLQVLLDRYSAAIKFLLSWAEPPLNAWLSSLPWHLPHLLPQWRHLLVATGLLLGAVVAETFKAIFKYKKMAAVAIALLAVVVAIPFWVGISIAYGLLLYPPPLFLIIAAAAVLFNAVLLIGAGALAAFTKSRETSQEFLVVARQNSFIQMGKNIFDVAGAVLSFILLNVGLKLAGFWE